MQHSSFRFSFLGALIVVLVLAVGSAIPCSVDSLTAHFLSCNDNGTSDPADDYFIADFTTTFTDFPATGDIALDVGGVTYSTSTSGLGTQFQFLSIPLSADGLPVQATIRFTADAGCALTETVGTAPGPCSSCATDADCDDGILCNGVETCDTSTGMCGAIDPCPAAVFEECLVTGACDWAADECLPPQPDDSLCAVDEICAPDGVCVIPQDVGSSLCRQVQLEAQQAVSSGGPYKNHGKKVSTAANVVSDYADWWRITEECSSCIVHQFAKKQIALADQEACGIDCPCFDASDILGQGIDYDVQVLYDAECINLLPDATQLLGNRVPGAGVPAEENPDSWIANAAPEGLTPSNQCLFIDNPNGIDNSLSSIAEEEVAACIDILVRSQMFQVNGCP